MTPTHQQSEALSAFLVAMADDEWMMGHRGSEWLALAPDLEEDLATSSISQDELGHAALLYDLIHTLGGPNADQHVYEREGSAWRHAPWTARPRGSWAEWVSRRYLYAVFDHTRRSQLERIPFAPLTAVLKKMEREEAYHAMHLRSLMTTLARGGAVSRTYLESAIAEDWRDLPELFDWGTPDDAWISWHLKPPSAASWAAAFETMIRQDFAQWELSLPGTLKTSGVRSTRYDLPELAKLLGEMRAVRLQFPGAVW